MSVFLHVKEETEEQGVASDRLSVDSDMIIGK